jgi:hypothetical protein
MSASLVVWAIAVPLSRSAIAIAVVLIIYSIGSIVHRRPPPRGARLRVAAPAALGERITADVPTISAAIADWFANVAKMSRANQPSRPK